MDFAGQFDLARKKYGGSRRGLKTEFAYYCKCHKDWRAELPKLVAAIEKEWRVRAWLRASNRFCPPWKNFKTWIYNRCWEQEWPEYEKTQERAYSAIMDAPRKSEPTRLLATEEDKKKVLESMPDSAFKRAMLRKKENS
jgi:hypothetical protein